MKKSTLFSQLSVFVLLPGALVLGYFLPGRAYYLTSTMVIIFVLIPFFLAFEGRKPQPRELTLIAVLCALAVASRAAFAWLPNFKPIYAVVIISGIAFGGNAGFLVGAISAFASNFLFGQGPWTPWQMLAYGICGFLAGVCYHRKNRLPKDAFSLGLFGFAVVLFVVCPILDTAAVFTGISTISKAAIVSIYTAAIITNIIQAACTFITLLLLSKPFLFKLERIITKYGLHNQ